MYPSNLRKHFVSKCKPCKLLLAMLAHVDVDVYVYKRIKDIQLRCLLLTLKSRKTQKHGYNRIRL